MRTLLIILLALTLVSCFRVETFRAYNLESKTIEAVTFRQPADIDISLYKTGDTVWVGHNNEINNEDSTAVQYLLRERMQ